MNLKATRYELPHNNNRSVSVECDDEWDYWNARAAVAVNGYDDGTPEEALLALVGLLRGVANEIEAAIEAAIEELEPAVRAPRTQTDTRSPHQPEAPPPAETKSVLWTWP